MARASEQRLTRKAATTLGAADLAATDLALLRGIADRGDLATAARAAGLTRGAAERRIARLARLLGTPPAAYGTGTLRLTSAGARVLTAGTAFRAELSHLVSVLDRPESPGRGVSTLRIAGPGRSWADWLADDLASTVKGLVVGSVSAEPEEGRKMLDGRSVDALYTWHLPEAPGRRPGRPVTSLDVLEEPLWVTLPRDHPAASADAVPLAALAGDEWVVDAGSGAELLALGCGRAGFAPHIGGASPCQSTRRSLLLLSRRVALTSPLAAPPLTDTGTVRRPLGDPLVRRHVLHADPAVVSPALQDLVRDRLRRGYVALARRRNPGYLRSPAFPVRGDEPGRPLDQQRLLTGLPTAPAGPPRPAGPAGRADADAADLRLLQSVAASGSINRAATQLMITQPALSRRLTRFEARLGVQLLVRGASGATLTPAGWRLVDRVVAAEAAFAAAIEQDCRIDRSPAILTARSPFSRQR